VARIADASRGVDVTPARTVELVEITRRAAERRARLRLEIGAAPNEMRAAGVSHDGEDDEDRRVDEGRRSDGGGH
jgi:hypothetical protein